jgi:capsular exopolysaccharide synthesis family protein
VLTPPALITIGPQDVARVMPASALAVSQPASTPVISPMSILRALRRRLVLALGAAILAAGISGPAAYFLVPAKYRAQSRLLVAAAVPKVIFQTVETEGRNDDYRRYQVTQATLVKSQFVLNAALQVSTSNGKVNACRTIQEQADPIAWLQDNLKVDFVSGSEVMEIALSGDNPRDLADIVNAVKKAYMDEVGNKDANQRSARHATLKKIKDNYAAILKDRQDTLRKLAENVGSEDRATVALRQQLAMEHQARLKHELLEVQLQKKRLEAQLKTRQHTEEPLTETAARTISEADIERAIDQHPAIAALNTRLATEENQLATATANLRMVSRNGSRGDPALKRLKDELAQTEKLIDKERKRLRPSVVRRLQEQDRTDQVVRGDQTQQELAMYNELEKSLNNDIDSKNKDNQTLTSNTLDLQSIQDEVAQYKDASSKVAAEVEALNVEIEAPSRIRSIEDASVPVTKDAKRQIAMICMSVFGSFFAGLFGIAFLELQTRKVDSADEVPSDLGLSVVGALPILPSKTTRGKAAARQKKDRYWQNILLESIDATRTMLVHTARTESHRVVMIASAVGGEGKTSLASYLATSLARSGVKTLLVDADLRSPAIHQIFDLPLNAGLSEVLRGEAALADAIGETAITGLNVLSAGKCDQQTIRMLAQGSLGPVFSQLKEQFDFVIVDSSPILPVADSMLVAQQADAVLFSIFRDVSRKTKVFAAAHRLQCLGVRILGAVVTGTAGDHYGNSYYKYRYGRYGEMPETAASPSDPGSST